jgi:hypothetical protein
MRKKATVRLAFSFDQEKLSTLDYCVQCEARTRSRFIRVLFDWAFDRALDAGSFARLGIGTGSFELMGITKPYNLPRPTHDADRRFLADLGIKG